MSGTFYSNPLVVAGVLLSLLKSVSAASKFPDGETVVFGILHYVPNKPVAIIAGALYLLLGLGLLFRIVKRKDWWGLCLPIGAIGMALGFFVRFAMDSDQNSITVYIVQQLLIVLSPALFLAFNYIVYGRLILQCIGREYSLIRPEIVTRVFVISDGLTFLIQSGGGSMETSAAHAKLGANIFLIGLIIQALSYLFFVVLFCTAHYKISKQGNFTGQEPWRRVIYILYFSSVFILIRSLYRVIELAQGHGGYLLTHEVYFYFFDSLPLFVAIVVYLWSWPGVYMEGGQVTSEQYSMNTASNTQRFGKV